MLNIIEKMNPLVKNVLVKDKTAVVVVPSIKEFKKQVVDTVCVRKNARRNPEARYHDLVVKYVRETQNLKGKWMNIRVLAETGKPDLFRDEKGHFVKVEV
jgi:hypothetical protein